jgi:nicotinate-nucleotide adenylyltransferase
MGTRRLGRPVTESSARGDSILVNREARSGAPWIDPADRRVGILGGTFDPIHYGHLLIADLVREALQLDRVLFVPAAMPPHKMEEQIAPASDRAAMVKLAIAGNPLFTMCEIEMGRPGPSYTVDTLSELADEAIRQGVQRELHFILSVEALALFKSWHEPARLLELARLAVVARPGAPIPVGRRLGALLPGGPASMSRVECIRTLVVAHSASDVRARVAAGRSIRYLVPPAVEAYIRDHRLYRSEDPRRTA